MMSTTLIQGKQITRRTITTTISTATRHNWYSLVSYLKTKNNKSFSILPILEILTSL